MQEREEKENFINKKFNKARKDFVYGPLSGIQKKMKCKQYKDAIDKINSNKCHKKEGHPCHFCENTMLKDMKVPIEKVNKLFLADFLNLKYNRIEDEEQ